MTIETTKNTLLLDVILKTLEEETGEPFEKEYRFYPPRRWRFDAAFPRIKVAVEIEGGVWSYGRHNRAASFLKDMKKYNTAAINGWCVLRYTWDEVKKLDMKQELLGAICQRL